MFYEAMKDVTEYGKQRWHVNSSLEGLVLGGLAGGMSFALLSISKLFRIDSFGSNYHTGLSAYLTTPLDVIKTRLQVQGSSVR